MYGQVADARLRRGTKTYWKLLRQLYCTEFEYFVPNDDDRAEDGKDIRREWAAQARLDVDEEWLSLGCSFLEMLLGLARRLEFQTEKSVEFWFWHLVENLGFKGFHDRSGYSQDFVRTRLYVVNRRLYDFAGTGGLFPLRNPSKDQRKVDLWYQMMEYILQDM
jgi:hypothetical protein